MAIEFDDLVQDAEKAANQMQGWDFSYVTGRRHEDSPPWDYAHCVCSLLDGVDDMLDMDTGGGEMLLAIKERAKNWPGKVLATEAYEPNVVIAAQNLNSSGIEVVSYESNENLPFDNESFDLITNRHGGYSIGEIQRLLRPHGVFITQQIGFASKRSFGQLLSGPDPLYKKIDVSEQISRFEECGFDIVEHRDFNGSDVFNDVGAIVFMLTAAAWEVPGFSVHRYRKKLFELHEAINTNGPIDVGISFTLLVVRKQR